MADNTDEEYPGNPINTQSENSPDEIITANDTETINTNQEPENMETHAHHLHHAPGKKIWHYFYEFLMLFLAVFCGFLAENKREHMVEHSRARAYAQSLYKDLQNDTADIKKSVLYENRASNMIDSLIYLINSSELSQKGGQLYFCMRFASWRYNVDWNRATLDQLISSGNLRYFTNTQLVTQISNYKTVANIIKDVDDDLFEKNKRAYTYKDRIVIPKYEQVLTSISMEDVLSGRKNSLIDSIRNTNMPLQNNAYDMLNAYANSQLDAKRVMQSKMTKNYPKAIKLATEIMELLKKEYNLE